MVRTVLVALVFGLAAGPVEGQSDPGGPGGKRLVPLPDLVGNSVQTLAATGDSLWSGPLLTLYLEPDDRPSSGQRFLLADEPALTEEDNLVSAIAARRAGPDRALVWAGLVFDTGGGEPGAAGFLVSSDGGETFERRGPHLDAPTDTTVAYGASTVRAVPVTRQAGSTPQDLAFGPAGDTAWVAGLRSGLRWTVDQGETWTRAVLPPDTSQFVSPTTPTDLLLSPPLDDGRGSRNHVAYSVLVDETGAVWAGTAGGLNRGGGPVVEGRRAWQRYTVGDAPDGPTGDVVVALAEQPRAAGRNPVWLASWAGRQREGRPQRFGVAMTPDGGRSFRQTLIGERIYDLAARSSQVYAAGETGLFVSADQGRTWRSVERFPLQSDEQTLPSDVTPRAVAVTDAALWVGTTDGLLRLDRSEEGRLPTENPRWHLFRAETPVNPDDPSEQVPDVSTYAYPNPFVPSRDQLVRIVYELDEPGTVEINIYDFGMNRVRTITDRKPAGQHETVWRGRDSRGLRVPTGTYFYTVDLGERTVDGKILVAH